MVCCFSVAAAHPDTKDYDVKQTSTTVRITDAPTTRPASTSFRLTDATAVQDSWENIARRKYPFAQKDMTHARTEGVVSTTVLTTAVSAQSVSSALTVPTTWTTVLIICARLTIHSLYNSLLTNLAIFDYPQLGQIPLKKFKQKSKLKFGSSPCFMSHLKIVHFISRARRATRERFLQLEINVYRVRILKMQSQTFCHAEQN